MKRSKWLRQKREKKLANNKQTDCEKTIQEMRIGWDFRIPIQQNE